MVIQKFSPSSSIACICRDLIHTASRIQSPHVYECCVAELVVVIIHLRSHIRENLMEARLYFLVRNSDFLFELVRLADYAFMAYSGYHSNYLLSQHHHAQLFRQLICHPNSLMEFSITLPFVRL